LGVATLTTAAVVCREIWGALPTLGNIYPLTVLLPLLVGFLVTIGAGGMNLASRVKLAVVSAVATALLYACLHAMLAFIPALGGERAAAGDEAKLLVNTAMWGAFIFTLLATISALLTEINLPEPKLEPLSEDLEQPEAQDELGGDVGVDTGDDVVQQDAPSER
jgi:hypothetical protein